MPSKRALAAAHGARNLGSLSLGRVAAVVAKSSRQLFLGFLLPIPSDCAPLFTSGPAAR